METKIRLSLSVPGAGMLTQGECDKNPKESYDISKMTIETKVKDGKRIKVKKEILTIRTRKSKVVKQNINITTDAYYHMVSSSEIPAPKYARAVGTRGDGTPISLWSTMKPNQRLKVHLDLIAEHFNATGYTYEVLDD